MEGISRTTSFGDHGDDTGYRPFRGDDSQAIPTKVQC